MNSRINCGHRSFSSQRSLLAARAGVTRSATAGAAFGGSGQLLTGLFGAARLRSGGLLRRSFLSNLLGSG